MAEIEYKKWPPRGWIGYHLINIYQGIAIFGKPGALLKDSYSKWFEYISREEHEYLLQQQKREMEEKMKVCAQCKKPIKRSEQAMGTCGIWIQFPAFDSDTKQQKKAKKK